jgi:GNAT superfamily N-acetyltransferase
VSDASAPAQVRAARDDDVELIFGLIIELAEYERAPEQVVGSAELLRAALFGPAPSAEALIAERDGTPIGFALFHGTFSTWECQPGLWLEDLYVRPSERRDGAGGELLRGVATIAVQRGCTRLGWAALGWNTPALRFYEKLGAQVLDEWKLHRLSGDGLRAVAAGGHPA